MPGLYFDSGIGKGFENDLKTMNSQYNSFAGNVEQKNTVMSKSFNKLAVSVGAAFSVASIVRFGKESVDLYRNQQKALAQVEQGLKSTGYASGKTFDQLKKDAADLQKTTLFGDEDILQNATAQLLTFTNIADDNFTRTQKVALDLATRLDGDLKSASIQLGKALNDPIANLSALSRSGIQFSTEQKDLIKSLAETGRLAEAQTIILDELEKQYGGSAEAAAKADGGFTQLSNTIGDVREVIGGTISEGLQPLIENIREFLDSLSEEDIRNFVDNVKDGARVIGILIVALTAWKAGLLIMNKIQKINTALTALNTQAMHASARAGKQVSAVNVLMANSMKKLKAAFAANPIGLIATALTIAIPLIKEFTSEISDATYVQNELIDVNKKAEKSVADQQVRLNQLLAIAKDETASLKNREEAVRQLNAISPEYLGNLTLATINTDEAKKATEEYTAQLLKQARVQAATEKLVEVEKQIIDVKKKSIKESTNVFEVLNDLIESGFSKEEAYRKIAETSAKNKAKEEQKLIKLREELLKITTDVTNQELILSNPPGNEGDGGAGAERRKKALKAFQKQLDDQRKAYEQYNNDIEGLSDERLQIVQNEYKDLISQGETYIQFLENLLETEQDAKKRAIIKREIDIVATQNVIAQQQAAEEAIKKAKDDLKRLEESYRTYSQKRLAIENDFNNKINALRTAGYNEQAQQAEKALQAELKRLEDAVIEQNAIFQKWVSEELPMIAKEGVSALKTELEKVELSLKAEGLDPEQVIVYKREIEILTQKIDELTKKEKDGNLTWKDTLEILNGVNELVNEMGTSLDFVDDSTKTLFISLAQTTGGVLNMITAFKALRVAVTTLEKASAILAFISAVLQVINTLSESFKEDQQEKNDQYAEEAKRVQLINEQLIRQNQLYKEGNELFAQDRWGEALTGLEAYNSALQRQDEIIEELIRLGEHYNEVRDVRGTREFYKQLSFLTGETITDLHQLDAAMIEAILTSNSLGSSMRAQFEALLDTMDLTEEAFAQFGDFIAGIFGSIGDDITQAFQTMYVTGEDAMTALEGSFSDMIETFTREALEFAFLQPYLNELNNITKALGEQYARGEISAEELQTNIVNTLGTFYDQMAALQPEILSAFENADRIAEAAGFAAAFNPEDVEEATQEIIVDPEIIIPDIIIPDVEIPDVEIEDPYVEDIIVPDVTEITTEKVDDVSTPGRISQQITEETGTILAGRIGALVLSNEKLLLNSNDMLDYAIQNLVYMKAIKENTDYLPQIADNTRKTYEKLESV